MSRQQKNVSKGTNQNDRSHRSCLERREFSGRKGGREGGEERPSKLQGQGGRFLATEIIKYIPDILGI